MTLLVSRKVGIVCLQWGFAHSDLSPHKRRVHTAPHTYHSEANFGSVIVGHTTNKSSGVSQLQGLAPAALGSRQPS